MTEDPTTNPTHEPAADVRRYVDDELTPDEARVFEARLERDDELASRVRGERALRGFVERAMGVSAPADLADRVRAGLHDEPVATARSRWMDGPTRVSALAVAASIARPSKCTSRGTTSPRSWT